MRVGQRKNSEPSTGIEHRKGTLFTEPENSCRARSFLILSSYVTTQLPAAAQERSLCFSPEAMAGHTRILFSSLDNQSFINRGYYTVARRYECYVWVARTISHEWAQRTSEILYLPREHKIHIFEPTCNVLFIIWRNQCNKSKRRESWRHWTIRHSQRWHTENTPLGSRMKRRMESTSGLVPSKTLSSI